jgi:membrane protein DedA with SNARE-associated domain/membrane-associated phospholipid phosphatase
LIDLVITAVAALGPWSYLVLFAVVFAECTLFTSVVVPGELIVVLAGFLCHTGVLALPQTLAAVMTAALLSYPAGFQLGRTLGGSYFRTHRRFLFLREPHLARVQSYLDEHGGKTILFSRFIGFLRALAPFTAGMGGMGWGRFLAFSLSGGVVWSITFVLLGYFLGESWRLAERWAGRFGLFLFFLLLLAVLFGWAYRKLVREQERISAWWRARLFAWAAPRRRLEARWPALYRFFADRLSSRGYLGLHLTVGLLLSSLLAALFVSVAANLVTDRPLVRFDQAALGGVLAFRHPAVTRIMLVLTQLGAAPFLASASVALIAFFLGRRRLDYLFGYLAGIAGGSALAYLLKEVVHRVRPLTDTLIGGAYRLSFPSGHAMMSMLFYGMIVYFTAREMRSWRAGVFLSLCSGFLVLLIGISRVYLQAQWASDVIAGYVAGACWLVACLTGLEVYRRLEGGNEAGAG